MSNFILIHGGSQGGWAWTKVKKILEDHGHKVLTPDLPGHEINSRLSPTCITFDLYVQHIMEIIKSINEKIIIVAHSLGGAVATKVIDSIDRNRIEKVIYVSAVVPQDGDSIKSLIKEDVGSDFNKIIEPDHDKMVAKIIPDMLDDIFLNGCSKEDIKFVKERMVPEPIIPFGTPVKLSGKIDHNKIGIICTDDKNLTPEQQKRMYLRAKCKLEYLESGHAPFFANPDELCNIIMDKAN